MDVPNTFRFSTKIEVYSYEGGACNYIAIFFKRSELWEMGDDFYHNDFNDEGNTEKNYDV